MKKKPYKLPIRKRQALLLELMIAFTLVLLCLVPLLKPHLFIEKELIKRERRMQLERFAKVAAMDVKAQLFECSYSWETLKKGFQGTLNEPVELRYANGKVQKCPVSFSLSPIKAYHNSKAQSNYLLMQLEIFFSNTSTQESRFVSLVFLEKRPEGLTT